MLIYVLKFELFTISFLFSYRALYIALIDILINIHRKNIRKNSFVEISKNLTDLKIT